MFVFKAYIMGERGKIMNSRTKGIICIILSAFCFAVMNACVRASGDLPSIEKSFFRNLVAAIVAFIVLMKNHTSMRVGKGNLKYLLLRATCGTLGILCNFYAIDHLVLSDASMLNKMSPFFVIIFSYLILKERLNSVQILAVIGAFAGSLLVVKPTFSNLDLVPALIGLMGGLGAGIAYTMVRILGQRGVDGSFVVFFFSVFSCVVTLPYLIFAFEPMSLRQFLILMGAGVAATGGQFGITKAYYYAPAREISVYDYSQIVFAAGLGFLLFGEMPDGYSVLGYIVICAMAVMMFLYNRKMDLKEKKA
jgi:drug/metabolite transporter (DMT)-like permease